VTTTSDSQSIVVGVDGSPGAAAALAWAIEEAALRAATLHAVHVYPAIKHLHGDTAAAYYPQVEQEANEVLDTVLADAPGLDRVAHERSVVAGSPAEELIRLSATATLLVVGSRGLGGFAGLVLDSVSAQCAQHASCPVVVVRVP
jgi:nucleotide-binding universal stress UspA family protein